ncbi:hypothetical protein HFD88_002849 [Aspergillus terreus]|nr:hypothetical protein HFD88_002849 [Aspergillus terreus]
MEDVSSQLALSRPDIAPPSSDQWEAVKQAVHRIYILNGRSKHDMRNIMLLIYHFDATIKMYNSRLAQWGISKNNKSNRQAPQSGGSGTSLRKRYDVKAAEKVFYALVDHALPGNPVSTHPPAVFDSQELVLFSVYDYILEAFNKGGYQPDQLHNPVDHISMTWQRISDKAYETGVLFRKARIEQTAQAYNWILRQMEPLAKSAHPYMMIKFWRVCYYLHQLGEMIGDHGHLRDFLKWFHALAEAENPSNRSIVRVLGALLQMVQDIPTLRYTLRIGYLRSIHCLQTVIGSNNHPTVLSMWANYAKHWSQRQEHLTVIIDEYQMRLQVTRSLSSPNLEREIYVLHGFLYFAFYVARDSALSLRLSSELLERSIGFIEAHGASEWRFEIQAFTLASKVTALILRSSFPESAVAYMTRAIQTLEHGDKECRSRALGLLDDLCSWYKEWEDVVEVERMARRRADLEALL